MDNQTSLCRNNITDVIPVIDPSTEEKIGEVPDGGPEAVDEAVARARASFRSGVWKEMPAAEKAKILWRAAEIVEHNVDELAAIESRNTGLRPIRSHIMTLAGADMLRYYAGWCTKIYGISNDIRMSGGPIVKTGQFHAYTLKEPVGVAGLIVPFNGPLYIALSKLAPALAAGCSCVLKPSSLTPLSAMKLMDLMSEAGIPDGVVNLINGYGSTTGAALAAHPDVDKLSFTGSIEVGKQLVLASAGNLKKLTLELGGKSPVLIYDDADLSRAIPVAAMSIFAGSGQGCVCGSRVYAQRGVYDQVVEGLAEAGKSLRLGGSQEKDVDTGPLISESQLNRVMGFINEGRQEGVKVVTGGNRLDRPGYFIEPTVLTNVRPDMRLMREEIFGPVVAVVPFDDEEKMIAEANNSIYGLAAAIWTKDIARAHRLAKRMEAGFVWLNCQMAADPSMPFGGYKQSGWGREYGWEGIASYLETKTVFTDISE